MWLRGMEPSRVHQVDAVSVVGGVHWGAGLRLKPPRRGRTTARLVRLPSRVDDVQLYVTAESITSTQFAARCIEPGAALAALIVTVAEARSKVRRWRRGTPQSSRGRKLPDLPVLVDESVRNRLRRARHLNDRRARRDLRIFLRSGRRVAVPRSPVPEVSVLIVVFGRPDLTLACLRSLESVTLPMETIIVDNGSGNATSRLLDRVDGATIIRNSANSGFARAANQAARRAQGRALLLVNSDVELVPGSLEAASNALDVTGAGAVGGRVVLPDGTLQEAGGVVWSDGSCTGIGRHESPDAPQHLFRRPVDYCSGAFLLVQAEAWEQAGGLDESYAPAYYEDVDLCLRLWELGLPVVYEPRAIVRHHEYGSSSPETAASLIREQRERFVSRHRAALASFPAPFSEPQPHLRRCGPPRVVVVEDQVPRPELGKGYPRSVELLQALVDLGWFVTLYPRLAGDSWDDVRRCVPSGVEVMLGWPIGFLGTFLAVRRECYDAVLVSRSHNLASVRAILDHSPELLGGARLIYDAEAITAERDRRAAELHGRAADAATAAADMLAELELAATADVIMSVSADEAEQFRRHPSRTPVVEVGHSIAVRPSTTPFSERRDLLFLGPLLEPDTPNADAVCWFGRHVLPLLRATPGLEDVRFVVVGHLGAGDLDIAAPGVTLVGEVADPSPYFESARVMVAPTRFAAGVPLKVYDAASRGLPVVASELLVDQLGWADGVHIRSASVEDPTAFADACRELYEDEARWQAIRTGALEMVGATCSRDRFMTAVASALGDRSALSLHA
jgi:GT2 family glycosyltransferase